MLLEQNSVRLTAVSCCIVLFTVEETFVLHIMYKFKCLDFFVKGCTTEYVQYSTVRDDVQG